MKLKILTDKEAHLKFWRIAGKVFFWLLCLCSVLAVVKLGYYYATNWDDQDTKAILTVAVVVGGIWGLWAYLSWLDCSDESDYDGWSDYY